MNPLPRYVAVAALSLAASAALPTVSAFAQDRVQYTTVQRDDMPRPVRHEADEQTRNAKDVKYQRQVRDGKTFYSVHFTNEDNRRMELRLDEEGKVVDGPHAARDQGSSDRSDRARDRNDDDARTAGDRSGGNDDTNVKYHGISARDVDREVPKAVRQTMDKHTQGAKDLFYQSQIRNGRQFYSVHYTPQDGKRMFVRVAENGELALGPAESQASERNAANPDYGRNRDTATGGSSRDRDSVTDRSAKSNEPWSRQSISADQLPQNVRRSIEQATNGGTNHSFVKQTRGGETQYVVEYDRSGSRTSAIFSSDGRVVEGETFAGAPQQVSQPVPTPVANQPAPATTDNAQLASAQISSGPYQLLSSVDQLPPAVRSAAAQELNGASSPLIQRFTQDGRTLYSVHYTAQNGQRRFMAVDEQGKVAIEPRKSNWQEGGKNAQFQVIGAGELPAAVRQQAESQAGSNHVFVQQTRENGKKEYLIQYDAAGGERMEYNVGEDGKLEGKPRRARDNPFTIINRKDKDD